MKPNYNENLVPDYSLPELLLCSDGTKVNSDNLWKKKRRKEIVQLFEEHVYGKTPNFQFNSEFKTSSIDNHALNGKAIRKEITGTFSVLNKFIKIKILIYTPKNSKKPVPIWLGLNFRGNQSVNADSGISLSKNWILEDHENGIFNNKATEKSRGALASRWPIEKIIARGYGLATIFYGDLCSDLVNCFTNSAHSLFFDKNQIEPKKNEWAAIGSWAWGLSRAMDYFETDINIDSKKVAVMGLSRLGKSALWAAAQDERFALVAAVCSGCGGASIFRRCFGETIAEINTAFPHWFCDNFKKFNNKENQLPIDQHSLLALIAPRPVYIASAKEDLWADPYGEFLATKNAEKVYQLFEKIYIGYHIRKGKHNINNYDWNKLLKFSDKFFMN